jgi:acyl carrier protein
MPQATMNDIRNIIANQLGTDEVNEDDRIIEDLGAESTDLANILSAIQDKYGVTVDEKSIRHIRRVRDIYAEVQKLASA